MAWYNTDWEFRKEITLNGASISGSHTNFPILWHSDVDTDLSTHASGNGHDIVFTDDDGVTRIHSEIENYVSGSGNIWIRVPNLVDGTDKTIYMYYGNIPGGDQEDIEGYRPSGVWNDNFVMVQHLADSTTSVVADSTKNSYDGDKGSENNPIVTTASSGMVATAQRFDGTDWINYGQDAASEGYNALTIEGWVYRTSNTPSGWRTPLHRSNSADSTTVGASVFFIAFEATSHNIVSTIGAGSTGPSYTSGDTNVFAALNTWYYVVCSWDGSKGRTYVDGTQYAIYDLASLTNSPLGYTRIGSSGDGDGYLTAAIIDEVRISDNFKTPGWIKTTYNTIKTPSAFLSTGGEELNVNKWISALSNVMNRIQYYVD